MNILIIVAVLLGALAVYIAVKAHLHHASLSAELQNQAGKVKALEQQAADKAKAELDALKAKVP